MSERAVPFHCPYCGDENLRPHETDDGPGHGTWECRACLRAFQLKMLGMIPHGGSAPTGPEVRR
jgi:transcription elongation factor Elf1